MSTFLIIIAITLMVTALLGINVMNRLTKVGLNNFKTYVFELYIAFIVILGVYTMFAAFGFDAIYMLTGYPTIWEGKL